MTVANKTIWNKLTLITRLVYRYLISCPKEVTFTSDMYKVPVPEEMKNAIQKIFTILMQKHEADTRYTFNDEARAVFYNYHDNFFLEKKIEYADDENRRGVLSKSLGYIIRLSGILAAIDNASLVVEGICTNEMISSDCDIHVSVRFNHT